jgi:1,2-diacylglycerol 3-beta-galactosyltransferase
MTEKKRVLILMADAGFGHRSAALAVQDAILDKYGEQMQVDLVNPLDLPTTPTFLRDTQSDYDKFVRNVPELYSLGYQVSDNPIPTALLESSISMLLVDTMRELFNQYHPDVVLSTYPWYQVAMSALFTSRKYRVPNYTVVTIFPPCTACGFTRKPQAAWCPILWWRNSP